MEYENFQRTFSPDVNNPAAQQTNNVQGSTIQGIEAALSGQVGALRWDASVAYNDGTYGSLQLVLPMGVVDGVNPTLVASTFNLEGQSIDYLPEFTWNLGLSYHGWQVGGGKLIPSVRVSHQGEYYTTYFQYDYNLTPSKTLVDVFLAYEAEKNWRLELYARNAGDEEYIARAQGGTDAIGNYLLGAPRQVGLKLNYSF